MDKKRFDDLFKRAAETRERSYSPISKFKVGAAFVTEDGDIFAGTNVEEAALTSTLHAEQNAIGQMVAAKGPRRIVSMVVVGGNPGDGMACTPCGHCRQLMLEFADADLEIVAADPAGKILATVTLGELTPHAFSMRNLAGTK